MNNNYRYILQKNGKKHLCPECGKITFVRYIDSETGNVLPERYGRCDREVKCSYHLNPYKNNYGKEEGNNYSDTRTAVKLKAAPPVSFIPVEILKKTLKGYEENVFIRNLLYNVPFPFEIKDIEQIIALYFLGTVIKGERAGAVTFPFIDKNGKIRTIQAKQFDLMNHTIGTDFVHSIIERSHNDNEPKPDWLESYQKNERKVSCLFGEHLLKDHPYNPIALVEAPKTAIYGSLYFGLPVNSTDFLWMAVYNLSSLNFDKVQALQGRKVYLFPDLSKDGKAFNLWSSKARELSDKMPGTLFKVSDLLEKEAIEKERLNGLDLADFLIRQDWRKYRTQVLQVEENIKKGVASVGYVAQNKTFIFPEEHQEDPIYPTNLWDQDISELEQFFKIIPSDPIQLNKAELITDPKLFIESHMNIVIGQNGNERFRPYLDRLIQLKMLLSKN